MAVELGYKQISIEEFCMLVSGTVPTRPNGLNKQTQGVDVNFGLSQNEACLNTGSIVHLNLARDRIRQRV